MKLQPVYRITVFVPPADLARLKQGILAVDDLAAGGYAEGMWESAADEQYRVLPGTRSVQGQGGERVQQPTVRLEFCIPRGVPGDRERLQRLLDEAAKLGMYVHIGLPYNENWWTAITQSDAQVANYLQTIGQNCINYMRSVTWQKHSAFGGWYIPYEIEQYDWGRTQARVDMITTWLKGLSDVAIETSGREPSVSTYFSEMGTGQQLAVGQLGHGHAARDDAAVAPHLEIAHAHLRQAACGHHVGVADDGIAVAIHEDEDFRIGVDAVQQGLLDLVFFYRVLRTGCGGNGGQKAPDSASSNHSAQPRGDTCSHSGGSGANLPITSNCTKAMAFNTR